MSKNHNTYFIKHSNKYDKKINRLESAAEKLDLAGKIFMIVGGLTVATAAGIYIGEIESYKSNIKNFKSSEYYITEYDNALAEAETKFKNDEYDVNELTQTLDYLKSDSFAEELMKRCEDTSFYAKHKKSTHAVKVVGSSVAAAGAALMTTAGVTFVVANSKDKKAYNLQNEKEERQKQDEEEGDWDFERWNKINRNS